MKLSQVLADVYAEVFVEVARRYVNKEYELLTAELQYFPEFQLDLVNNCILFHGYTESLDALDYTYEEWVERLLSTQATDKDSLLLTGTHPEKYTPEALIERAKALTETPAGTCSEIAKFLGSVAFALSCATEVTEIDV